MTVLIDGQMTNLIGALAGYAPGSVQATSAQYVNAIPFEGRTADDAGIARLRDTIIELQAEAIIVRSTTTVNEALLHGTPIRFVISATAGIDHVDTQYLNDNSIGFSSAKGCNANAVADYVLLAIDIWRNTPLCTLPKDCIPTLGIVGRGNVGSILAQLALQDGLNVIVYDPPLAREQSWEPHTHVHELNALLEASDIVSLHVPLTHEGDFPTANMMDAPRVGLLRPGALLINTSRGGVVDESALLRRLEAREICAVLDVYLNEPNIDLRLMNAALLSTPHVAGYSIEARDNLTRFAGVALLQWLGTGTFAFIESLAQTGGGRRVTRNLITDTKNMREMLNGTTSAELIFDVLRRTYALRHESRHLPPPTIHIR